MNKKLKTLLYSDDPVNVELGIMILNNDPDIKDLMSMMVKYYQPTHTDCEYASYYTFGDAFRIIINYFSDTVIISGMNKLFTRVSWGYGHRYRNVTRHKEHYWGHLKPKVERNVWKEIFMAQFAVDRFQELVDSGKLFN